MSHHRKKPSVRILNAMSGAGWTSHRQACRYVSRGWALWRGNSIEFIPAAPRSIAPTHDYDRASRSGLAPIRAIRNLPVVGRVELLLTRRTA